MLRGANMQKIEPLFDFTTDESNILIHQSQAEVCINGNIYKGNGAVRLELIPQADIHVYGYFKGVSARDISDFVVDRPNVSFFSINGRKLEGFYLSNGGNITTGECNIKWCPESEPINGVGDESTEISLLIFHLFNFGDFIGTRKKKEQVEGTYHSIECVDLNFGDWQVQLESLPSTRENIKTLKKEGGYRLTHIGVIKKVNGAYFSGNDAQNYLDSLKYFLSFAKGGWCVPICAVGFDATGSRVWESWSSPQEPWRIPRSWFDRFNSIQLAILFPGFMNKLNEDEWGAALRGIIYWYLSSNFSSRGVDAGIILTQTAIERLSYEYAVKDKRLLTVKGFKDLWASDKFRILFSSLGIPLEIPNETPELQKHAKNFGWLDAQHALTEIRNSIVHPENKKCDRLNSALSDAWNLGLWYLEMGLLAICGYSGTYGNRLKKRYIGQVEEVPWNKKQ
jgi:hypothetical protein